MCFYALYHKRYAHVLKSSIIYWQKGIEGTQPCDSGIEIVIVFSSRYRQVSNIRRTLVGNKFVDHSDVVGASPVGAAPTTSSFST